MNYTIFSWSKSKNSTIYSWKTSPHLGVALSCEKLASCFRQESNGFPPLWVVWLNPHIQGAGLQVYLKKKQKQKKSWCQHGRRIFKSKFIIRATANKMCYTNTNKILDGDLVPGNKSAKLKQRVRMHPFICGQKINLSDWSLQSVPSGAFTSSFSLLSL